MVKKDKPSNLDEVHHWTGIYKFELPYMSGHYVSDENGEVKVYTCDVEIHIGGSNNLEQKRIATVIISAQKNGVGTTNFIENIATLIKTGYIEEVVRPKNGPIHDRIRWVERNYYPKENFKMVSLEWDAKSSRYIRPSWEILDNDWILEKHKLNSYN